MKALFYSDNFPIHLMFNSSKKSFIEKYRIATDENIVILFF